jgi:hypothetical protein
MRKEIETYELIEQYLNNQLSVKGYSDIESRIQSDPGFASLVEQQRNIHDFINNSSLLSVGAELEKIHKKHNTTSKGLSGWKWILFVLSGILFTSIILFQKHRLNNPTTIPDKNASTFTSFTTDSTTGVSNDTINKEYQAKKSSTIHPQIQDQHSTNLVIPDVESAKQQAGDALPAAFKPLSGPITSVSDDTLPDFSGTKDAPSPDNQDSTQVKQEEPVQIDLCKNIKIIGEADSKASCLEKPTGQIIVLPESLKGGAPPYEISADKDEGYSGQLTITGLTPGYYQVYVRDKNNCTSNLGEYFVESKTCTYEYVFAPDKGESWTVPDFEIPYTLKIFRKNGQVVFRERIDYDGNFEWNGRANTGDELPMGAYMFILESDNRETLYGTVTLIR